MKIMKMMPTVLIALLVLTSLAGCESACDPEPINISFIVGIADDETKINDGIAELVALPTLPGTDYAFISVEGEPTTIGEPGRIPDFSDSGYTDVMLKRVHAGIKADLTEQLANYTPSSAQIDMAGAIQLGVRQLNARAAANRKNILVLYCSGKSSTRLINMVETPVYKLDIEASVPIIAEKMSLDMSNIDQVIWYCCGETGGPSQPVPSPSEKAKMKEFYKALFIALGMDETAISFRDDLPAKEYYQFDATPVSCMSVESTVSMLEELGPEGLVEPIALQEVTFVSDKAEYLHPEEAESALEPVAEFLRNNDVTILLCGTTAGDTDSAYTMELSEARAERVKQSLVARSIDPSRIKAVGLGSTDPWHIYGISTSDKEASCNRSVVLLNSSSPIAKEILSKAG